MPEPKLFQLINKTPLQQVYEDLTKQGALAKKLNAHRDLDTTHDFDYWEAKDSVINDWSAFNAIERRVMENRAKYSSFVGDKSFDYENMSMADIAYYEDFLGGILKKIGHAATSVAHGVRSVATDAAHGVRDVAQDAAHATRTGVTDVAHVDRAVLTDTGHIARSAALDVAHDARAVGKAAAPYWKVILTAALVATLAATGVGIPLALAIGGAALSGLDSIQPKTPYLTPEAGDGGGGDGGDDGDGAGDDDSGEPTDQSQSIAAQQQAQADQQAQAAAIAAASHKKKLILIAAGVVAAIIVIWWIRRKK